MFPFDQVFSFPMVSSFLQDGFHFIFFLTIDFNWWWCWLHSSWKFLVIVCNMGLEEVGVEYWMYVEFSLKIEFKSIFVDLFDDLEGSDPFW